MFKVNNNKKNPQNGAIGFELIPYLVLVFILITFDQVNAGWVGTFRSFTLRYIYFKRTGGMFSSFQLKVDALIKRGSLKMQLAKDQECYKDFDEAIQIDETNANIYHHRGQVS